MPVSDALRGKLPGMSRAKRFQAIRIENGLCAICGDEPLYTTYYGLECAAKRRKKNRARMRKKTGAKRVNRSPYDEAQ